MTREEIIKSIDEIIAASVGNHNFELSNHHKPTDILGWDSMANAMILTSIEQHFGIKFKFSDMIAWKTVGDLINIIESKLS